MTSEIENIRKNIDQCSSVTAVGNAWVICNSKSRPGLKYYFNTLTGQAVWNLSPIEIEKAKKFTKAIPISEIEKCPEPNTEPPMDHQIDPQQSIPMGVVPSQIINNQIPNIFPINLLNGLPGVSGYNSNIWTNPPNNTGPTPQVIYVALPPSMGFQAIQEHSQQLPLTHCQNNIFNAQKQYSQKVHMKQNSIFNRGRDKFNRMKNNIGRSRFSHNVERELASNVNNADLRQKLSRKRSKSLSNEPDVVKEISYQNFYTNHENIGNQNITQEAPSKYDLSFLEQLKPPHSKANNWFIVVDTEIILNNFPFLNKITDPDQNCYLMVPHHVMSELEQLSSSGNDVRSRRIYRFLSAQIDSELAFKGDDMSNVIDNDAEKMLATCVELSIQNNVILLSNNFKWYNNYKTNRHNVVILTLEEIKKMLNKPVPRTPLITKSPTLSIKIVVPNDRRIEPKETVPLSGLQPKLPDIEAVPQATKEKDIYIQPKSPSLLSNQSDAEVDSSKKHLDVQDQRPIISPPAPEPSFEKCLENLSVSNNEKKKEIKLSRNFSNQKTNHEVPPQLKQFRWRKQRRSIHQTPKSSIANKYASNVDDDTVQQTSTSVSTSDKPSNLSGISPKTISPRAPSADRSSISSVCKKRECANVIIEETSTSGIISNTTMDCESVNSDLKKTVSVCEDVNYEMFQIVGQGMEEVLRTRREEWVLRFVQIMEDVLKEKLRNDSLSQSNDYAPLWAADLPELARCIIKKFSDHFNVVDAANKLSFTLQRISDDKGNISANIEPGQYMDMYSFGVYLIESLKSVTTDCEDLNVAHESLKKLLLDIQNANLDNSHTDPFPDDLNDKVGHTSETEHTDKMLQVFPDIESPIKAAAENDYIETQSGKNSYKLRSRKRTPTKVSNETQQRISTPQQRTSTNAETTFFSSLELSKRWNTNNAPVVKTLDFDDTSSNIEKLNNTIKTPLRISPSLDTTSESEEPKLKDAMINSKKDVMLSGNTNGDNISADDNENAGSEEKRSCTFVRNFTSIPEYERTLLNNTYNDYDDQEYADDNYDDYDGFFFSENEEINDKDDFVNCQIAECEKGKKTGCEKENVVSFENEKVADNETAANIDYETVPEYTNNSNNAFFDDRLKEVEISNGLKPQAPNNKRCWKDSDIENNKKFRHFITEFIGDINETFETVQKLCAGSVEELKSSQETSSDTKMKLKAACGAMLEIFNYLNSILDRECRSPEGNIILLLKQANLGDFVPDEELRKEYTDNISKCRDQAYTCYKTVCLIMKEAGVSKLS